MKNNHSLHCTNYLERTYFSFTPNDIHRALVIIISTLTLVPLSRLIAQVGTKHPHLNPHHHKHYIWPHHDLAISVHVIMNDNKSCQACHVWWINILYWWIHNALDSLPALNAHYQHSISVRFTSPKRNHIETNVHRGWASYSIIQLPSNTTNCVLSN